MAARAGWTLLRYRITGRREGIASYNLTMVYQSALLGTLSGSTGAQDMRACKPV
jgi:hypothetical protein